MSVKRREICGGRNFQFKQDQNKRPISEEQIQILSRPRKLAKKSLQKHGKSSEVLQYSKIPSIPEIKLTAQDMKKDPIQLLVELEKKYEDFGGVKLITPTQWQPPFCFNFGQIGIKTRIQHLHKLKQGKVWLISDGNPSYFSFSFRENEEAYNVRNFQTMAYNFQKKYKYKTNPTGGLKEEKTESQFWNLVNGKYDGPQWKYKTSIQYAADLPVHKYGSGFPLSENIRSKNSNFDYHSNLFNLNNIYKSPLSILKIADGKKQYISGVTTPWVYMGMMFSTFCWHVEDLWLNSLNYNHKGDTKTWYIIPKKYKEKFDQYVIQKTGRTDLLDRITFMLDPLEIMRNDIPVYKANQRPGDYVCTFYKAYHAGFSHGFNIGEAVNFASPLSLGFVQQSMNYIIEKKQKKPAVLSYDWLVYENKLSNKWGASSEMENIINYEYDRILEQQYRWIKQISSKYNVKIGQQICASSKYDKNSCSKCRNYQYLSSIRCADCLRNYCHLDFNNCCNGNFELVFRELNNDRKRITSLLKRNKKQI